jgi:hypothetical protein
MISRSDPSIVSACCEMGNDMKYQDLVDDFYRRAGGLDNARR